MLVVVTRAEQDAQATAARLAALGHAPLIAPVLVLRATGAALPTGPFDAALATSAHAFLDWGAREGSAGLVRLPLCAVGARTAAAARAAGFADVRIAGGDAAALVDLLRLTGLASAQLVYLAGRDRRPALEQALGASGARLTVCETYAAEAAAGFDPAVVARLAAASDGAVLHYSRRSADLFLALADRAGLGAALGRWRHVAISAEAAAPLVAAGLAPRIALRPTEPELFAALAP